MSDNSYYEFEDIFNELKDKKLSELSTRDIGKYLLVAEELDWVDENIGDDKIFYDYDKNLLENLSYNFADAIFRLIHEELLYDNTLHTEPNDIEEKENYELG